MTNFIQIYVMIIVKQKKLKIKLRVNCKRHIEKNIFFKKYQQLIH